MTTYSFGEQRLIRADVSAPARLLYQLMGVADPAHYLHFVYLVRGLAALQVEHPRRILDAGCGSGDYSVYLARRFPEAKVIGLDYNAERIARNKTLIEPLGLKNLEFEVGDLHAFDEHEAYDLIVSIDVLEHLEGQKEVLQQLTKALIPGGAAYYHLPTIRQRPVPFSSQLESFHEWAEEEHVADDRTAEEFEQLVKDSGLNLIQAEKTFGYWTGELANSLFVLPHRDTVINQVFQAFLAPFCRLLCYADTLQFDSTRYAVAIASRKSA